jgi:S-DNA-T family DNA segregation ATPase FtsK/SpoIIIE
MSDLTLRASPGRGPSLKDRALDALVRFAQQLGGLALIALAFALLAALLSYASADPSLNTAAAVRGPVANLLGLPGAYASDVLLQIFGLAAYGLPLLVSVWGAFVLVGDTARRWRSMSLAAFFALASIALSLGALPTFEGWPLGASLGGALGGVGAGLFAKAASFAAFPPLAPALAALAATLGLALFAFALGFRRGEWSMIGRALSWFRFARRASAEDEDEPPVAVDLRSRRKPKVFVPVEDDEDEGDGFVTSSSFAPAEEDEEARPRARAKAKARPKPAPKQKALDLVLPDDYALPSLDLLKTPVEGGEIVQSRDTLQRNADMLANVLGEFGVRGEILNVNPGPVVTLYELEPAPGTKSARVIGLADDIARSMSALSVRVAVVPGRNAIGIEMPNRKRQTVYLRELLSSQPYEESQVRLPLALGKTIAGDPVVADLAKMPHLLIAGTTGSGKSVGVNAMILSLLYRLPPERCRFIMIDPKMLELSVYDGIPHLLTPVVTEPKKAVVALKWTVREMEERYRAMSKLGVRNIDGYNARIVEARRKGEVLMRRVQTGFDADTGKPVFEDQPLALEELPFIVVVVDEFADLMLVAGKDIEAAVQRLAQMARAAGIHLLMATQRPSVDVITGTIKANFPTRISFQVTSKIDSRTILGEQGAEQLLGQGDMLYMAAGGRIMRVHGPFVTDGEVEKVVAYLRDQGEPEYISSITEDEDGEGFGDDEMGGLGKSSGDTLYDQAVALVARERKASTSFIQRHLQIGYNRAARIIEQMEKEGVVSQANHVGKREVLVGEH